MHCHSCESCNHCSCEHEHENESFLLLRLFAALALLAAALLSKCTPLYFLAYAIVGLDVAVAAVKGLFKGGIFNESFLMTIASLGAFAIGEYAEAVAVMIFYGFGEYIQDKAVDKSSDSITELIRMRPDHACVLRGGEKIKVAPAEVKPGETVSVLPGERIPLDGVLLSESALLDVSAVTGESMPVEYTKGDEIISGCINTRQEILISVTHTLEDSSTERIFRMVTEARENKSNSEKFISRFAKIYTPAVVLCALLLAFLPPLFVGNLSAWIHRGLIFLVASCPCALVLSVPLTYFAGMGLASKNGVLFKGAAYIEQLAKLNTAAFDKTGTLTKGEAEVCKCVVVNAADEHELLSLAAAAEENSDHPIAKSLKAYPHNLKAENFKELVGGVSATLNGKEIIVGNTKLTAIENTFPETAVHVLYDGVYMGSIYLQDTLRPESKAAIDSLKAMGIESVMITGDSESSGRRVAQELGIENFHTSVLPEKKLEIVKSLKGIGAFVGDGINDSPALSGAHVGIAMGGMGREAAMEAADVVIMDDNPCKVPLAVKIAKRVFNTAVFNIAFSLFVKFGVLVLGAVGIANMWLAVFADVGVALIAVSVAVLRCRKI